MMKKKLAVLLLCTLVLGGCRSAANELPKGTAEIPYEPDLPDTIRVDETGIPVMNVYIVEEENTVEMDIESYLCGVLAGEMKNDWPMEALKAQAILARTFVIKFLSEKQSKYEGADISTDIEEAQAYNAEEINDRVRTAVSETRGLIVCYENEPIYAWFHAHSGGQTAEAAEGLSYKDAAPYTKSVQGTENENADAEAQTWTAKFSAQQVIAAARACGVKAGDTLEEIKIGAKGESGRVQKMIINGMETPANEMRIALGSAKMKSTLLTDLSFENGQVSMQGKGYGHGVGMSQWGAYAMAEEGKAAEEIIGHYFQHVDIVQKWK